LSGMSCLQHASVAATSVDADDALKLCQAETLPKDIRDTLGRRFNGWKVQDSSNLLPNARQKWATLAPLACPGIASGHFEESRSVSYALLLVPTERSANGYKFVVFSAPPGQSFYGFKMLDQAAVNASAFFIHSVAVDRAFDSALKKQFRPKGNDVILLAYTDDKTASQNIFYFKGDSYDHAQVDFN
jgi:hypothetical protein